MIWELRDGGPPGPLLADQRVQVIGRPTACLAVPYPRMRAALSLSTTVGCRSGLGGPELFGRCSSIMSSPRSCAKNRPARGASPCISKKPTSTRGPSSTRLAPLASLTTVLDPEPSPTPEAQVAASTPGKAASSWRRSGLQMALMRNTWSAFSRSASLRANEVWR